MKKQEYVFEVPVVIQDVRTVYVKAETLEEALKALKNGEGDAYDGYLPEAVEHDFDNAFFVGEEEIVE